jgi:hypothetical protein
MLAPGAYIDWINAHLGFNPRAAENSNALSELVTFDLAQMDSLLGKSITNQTLTPRKNANVKASFATRNIDLVFDEAGNPLISVQVAVENKTIMTAHGKARKNRYGDIIAYCNHMHNHRRECVAGAIVVVNVSKEYLNPDSFAKDVKRPKLDMNLVVKETIEIFAKIPLRDTPDEPTELPEALAIIVVDYDGINPGKLVIDERAPQPKDVIYYGNFLSRLCALYEQRMTKQ